jgi:putative CocE/NonD family hydrolase
LTPGAREWFDDRIFARAERNLKIPTSGGATLAADLWLPNHLPAPAIVSYSAYRKDDLAAHPLDAAHQAFAKRGYASLLVDVRGLGGSTGRIYGALDAQEAQDGAALIEWTAAQSWCDGRVGAWGMSWGAITALAAATLQPRPLRAITAIMGFLDPAADWILPGGCETCIMPLGWASLLLAQQMMPPMFQDEGGRWLDAWTQRLEGVRPYLLEWKERVADEEFWHAKRLSASRITSPTFVIGGWRDICCAGVVRAYEALRGPRKLLMGPWGHVYPDQATHEPVNYLDQVCDWWDRWLLEDGEREAQEPKVTLFVQGANRWRKEQDWPVEGLREMELYLTPAAGLATHAPVSRRTLEYRGDPTVGAWSGRWDSLGVPGEQSEDDARSLTHTSDPFTTNLEVSGSATAILFMKTTERQEVHLAVRLCDVAPHGRSTLITTGWRKWRAQDGHVMEPVEIDLCPTSYVVIAGHRIRVSISSADFPHIWPSPTNPVIRLGLGGDIPSRVSLPVRDYVQSSVAVEVDRLHSRSSRAGLAPEVAAPLGERTITRDLTSDRLTVTAQSTMTLLTPSQDGRVEIASKGEASVIPSRPQDATALGQVTACLQLAGGSIARVTARILATRTRLFAWARVSLDEVLVTERAWRSTAAGLGDDEFAAVGASAADPRSARGHEPGVLAAPDS